VPRLAYGTRSTLVMGLDSPQAAGMIGSQARRLNLMKLEGLPEMNSSEEVDTTLTHPGQPLLARSTSSYFPFPFILPSAQRFFIARESRLLPAGVKPPRLRFFPFVVLLPLGLPRFFPPFDEADPRSAVIA
jgi:hypothetical protein